MEEGKYTANSGFTENSEELENTPAIAMSLILEIIHSFRIKYVCHSIYMIISCNKTKRRFFFFSPNEQT